ncbi:unnamed protein product [Schistosoma margrebowiei]|uniref:Uncharacterized protein n=1 Tax=Schistosoma margrebowiei TaxID=48269 RepID=A0A183NBG0_9TREM|nr:unnamed protein product [Schistosoma margrebowiei]
MYHVKLKSYADNSLRSCDAVHEDEHKFGQCLSCGRLYSFSSCNFRNSECFKCDDIGHVQSVCNTTVHLSATNIKLCNSDSNESSIHNNRLSLSTISKHNVESYSNSELNETCNFRNSECFKYDDIGHVQSVCNTTVHLSATNIQFCNSDSNESSIHNNHLSLSTISKHNVESYSNSELNETQNPYKITVSNQSTYQISHVIVPDIVFPNNSVHSFVVI